MSTTWRHLPMSAREIAVAGTDAVDAAQRQDVAAYETAVGRLAAADRSGLVLGAVVRTLLEVGHPDGLAGDDVRQVLQRCVRGAAQWRAEVDPHVMLVLLAGSLGLYDPEADETPPAPAAIAAHGPLLVADLLAATGQPFEAHLSAAFAEIHRREVHD